MVLGPDKRYSPRGQVCQLFDWIDELSTPPPEVLVEGPAGTGKSRAIGEFLYEAGTKWAGTKILVVRRFRADLHKGFQRTFEDMVLYPSHPLLTKQGGGSGNTREEYVWDNRSRLTLGHMEDPQRWYGSEQDIVFWDEANEAHLDQWERLARALRRGDRQTKCPWSLMMGGTNPDSDRHWMNLRCKDGRIHRIVTRHKDNPSLERAYLERLARLTGVRRRRLFLGEWCSAEGQILDTYDSERHVVQDPSLLPKRFKWYMAGLDFGSRNPGCLLVAGFDHEGECWLLREVYRQGRDIQFWADQIAELHEEFPMQLVICDSADGGTGAAKWMNERLGLMAPDGTAFVQPVRKVKVGDKAWGFATREHLKDLFAKDLIHILDDPWRLVGGPDPDLTEKGQPRSLTDEIPQFVYARPPEGRELAVALREDPDKMCADHGIDALINIATTAWATEFEVPEPKVPEFKPDTYGDILGHAAILEGSHATEGMESTFDPYPRGAFVRRRF